MIFQPALAARILAGEKTVTRRIANGNPRSPWYRGRCTLRPGRTHAVSTGRSRAQICRIRIDSVDLQPHDQVDDHEAQLEGFRDRAAFTAASTALHAHHDPTVLVWRIAFALASPQPPSGAHDATHASSFVARRERR